MCLLFRFINQERARLKQLMNEVKKISFGSRNLKHNEETFNQESNLLRISNFEGKELVRTHKRTNKISFRF